MLLTPRMDIAGDTPPKNSQNFRQLLNSEAGWTFPKFCFAEVSGMEVFSEVNRSEDLRWYHLHDVDVSQPRNLPNVLFFFVNVRGQVT